jgi:hypothetical protein
MIKSFRLFAQPSFLSGTARLVDLGGVFDKYNRSKTEEQADGRALASDWLSIGGDLQTALQRMRHELQSSR